MKKLIISLFLSLLSLLFLSSCADLPSFYYGTHHSGTAYSILFLGDSRIDWTDWSLFIPNEYYNYGKAGATTNDLVNNILPDTDMIMTDKVVISIGINDILYANTNTSIIIDNIQTAINTLLSRGYTTNNIYITNIIPSLYVKTDVINIILKNLVDFNGCVFIDVVGLENVFNNLDLRYTNDGLHYNYNGKFIFTQTVRGYIQ